MLSRLSLLVCFGLIGFGDTNSTVETIKRTLPAYTIAVNSNLLPNTSECQKQLDSFRDAVDRRKLWGLRILDANGLPENGFLHRNNFWMGSRSQCFDLNNHGPMALSRESLQNNTKYRNIEEEYPPFVLHYFAAHFRHNSTMQYHIGINAENIITLGLCLPESCRADELGIILKQIFKERTLIFGNLYAADFALIDVRDLKDNHQWLLDWRIIAIGVVLVLTVLMMILGTGYDILIHQRRLKMNKLFYDNNNITSSSVRKSVYVDSPEIEPSLLGQVILCWSIYTNTKIIFNTKLTSDSIPPIHGLRFFGMMWIIMIHTVLYMNDYMDNMITTWRLGEGITGQLLTNGSLSVDTFFVLSGFLLSWLFYKDRNKESNRAKIITSFRWFDFFGSWFKRIMRLTPAYIIVLGIVQMNFMWYSKTVMLDINERPEYVCAHYWWRNILYINNLFGRDSMCMSWSWYLSADMQFFVIGMFLLILSDIYFYTSAALLFILLVLSTIITGYLSYIYNYTPTLDNLWNTLDVLYDPPWARIGPYIVGMITAYILMKIKMKLVLKKKTLCMMWLIGSFCNIATLFGLLDREISVMTSAVYNALSRTVWGIGIAWILIACSTNNGGIVNKFLSLKIWIPLSRLTYCAYLLNPLLISSVYRQAETAMHLDIYPSIVLFLGFSILIFLSAYVTTLAMETPYILLIKVLTQQRGRYTSSQ